MKKIKNTFYKTNVLLIMLILILSNFMPFLSKVKALSIGEKVELVSLGECPHDLGVNDGYSITTIVGYYRNGEFYPAYCLNKDLQGVTDELSYNVNIDHIMKDTESYNKIWRVLMAGYPYNTPEQMGLSSWQHAYQATKMAVYCVTGQRNINEFFAYTSQGQEIVDCIIRLYNIAENEKSSYTTPICNMQKEGELYLEKINEKEYYIQKYNFSGNNEMPSFTVTSSEGIILNMQNKEQKNYSDSGSFKLAIEKNNLKQDKQINLQANATIKTYPILYGATSISGTQDYCLSSYPFEATQAYANLKITIPSINIKKVDKNTGEVLNGAEFNIYKDINENNKLDSSDTFLMKTSATNTNGVVSVKGLAPGKYIVKEVKAPTGYLLDSNVLEFFEIKANGKNIDLQFGDIEPLGKITINKTNNLGNKLAGAEFQIIADENIQNTTRTKTYYKKGEIIKTCITDSKGQIIINNLPLGKYLVKETKAPAGYLLNTNKYNVNLYYKDQNTAEINYTIDNIIDKEPYGTINIIKQDAEKGNLSQGDSTFSGAEYKIYAGEDIYNVAKTKKIYSKNQVIATRVINENGTTESITNLPMGSYYIKETKAPEGYLIDKNTYYANLTYKDQNSEVITSTVISKENVKKRQVNIFKSGINILSGLVPGLEGVEFTIKLNANVEAALAKGYSYAEIWNGIDEYGKKVLVDEERVQEAQKIAPTYSKIKTNETGNAYTDMLPFGKYIVKETLTPKDYETSSDFTFSITQDESEIKYNSDKVLRLVVNNEQMESYIKLIKKDKTTGKIVSASSTSFKIKATEDIIDRATRKVIWKKGEYITQKIGKTTYDTFTTNSKNLIISEKKKTFSSIFDDLGTIITPLKLPVGNYEIEEVETPNGFLKLEENIKFEINGIKDYDKEQNADYIKEIEIFNEQPIGQIIVNKEIIYRGTEETDLNLLNNIDLSSIKFKLTAKENILDKADNSIIYKEGEVIGTYNISKEGILEIENLPIGEYDLEEIKTIDGLVINKDKISVSLEKQDDTTKIYTQNIFVENKTTLVEIYKTDKNSGEQIKGAKLALYDEENEIATWTSDGTPYIIEGLSIYKKYKLKELEAPDGYYLSDDDLCFDVSNDEGLQKINITNELVSKNIVINKKDAETLNLIEKDFKFGLFEDEKCTNLIKEEQSNKKGTVVFNNLKIGTYYIKETLAPEYYNISNKILKIEINSDKKEGIKINGIVQKEENNTTEINFENTVQKGKIKINKTDLEDDNTKLEGVKFNIFNKQGTFVEKLVTDFNGSAISSELRCDMDYILVETKTKEGYILNSSQIEFRVNNEEIKVINIKNEKEKCEKKVEEKKEERVLPKTGF